MAFEARALARTLEVPIGAPAQRLMLLIGDRLNAGRPFPNVDEVAEARVVANRGAARNQYALIEEEGLVARQGHEWRTGYLTPSGERVLVQLTANRGKVPAKGHRAGVRLWTPDMGARTVHQDAVRRPDASEGVFRDGRSIAKLSSTGYVTKGRLRGARVYYLTLEERRTCPATCQLYEKCYGDSMARAVRWQHGDQLEAAIGAQMAKWHQRPRPVLIRLHELGDFYSPAYVTAWARWLDRYKWLNVFGYTAWTPNSPIGSAIARAKARLGGRFAIRWSGSDGVDGAVVYRPQDSVPKNAFACPEQTGRVANCSACGACWSTQKAVAFREH